MTDRNRLALTLAVLLLLVWNAAAAAPPHPSLPAPGTLDGLGVNINFTTPNPGELEMIAAAGFKWVRMDMGWETIEREKGKYNFSAYEPLVAGLEKNHLHALFILDFGNRLYAEPGDPTPTIPKPGTATLREAYARWAVATVGHFAGKGFLWETWNEPNLGTFWKPKPSATDYAALALATGKALRAAGICKDNHSGEALIGPASSTIDFPFLEACFKAGLLNYWCGVSIHPYRDKTPETVADDLRHLRAMISTYAPGSNIPVISGEWGYSTAPPDKGVDEQKQASYLVRELLTNVANDVPVSIWYDWRDDGDNPQNFEHHFGTVRRPYKAVGTPIYDPKPAYLAMKTMGQQLNGFAFNKQVSLPALNSGTSDIVIDLFTRGPDTRMVAWLPDGGSQQCALPVGACVLQAVNLLGAAQPDQTLYAASSTVTLTDAPAYFAPKSPDALLTAAAAWQKAPLDVLCDAPYPAGARLSFTNPLTQPVTVKGMTAPLAAGASVQIGSEPLAPSRMPVDKFAETDGQFHPRHAYLNLLSPRGVLMQNFTAVVRNYINVSALPPGPKFQLLHVENPSGAAWQAQAHVVSQSGEPDGGFPFQISLPAGVTQKDIQMPVDQVSTKPGQQIQVTAEGGTLTVPIPIPLAWGESLRVAPRGDPFVASTQTLATANPPEGPAPSGSPAYQLKYSFEKGRKYLQLYQDKPTGALEGKPDAIEVWINGDGENCTLMGRFRDSTGQSFQLDGAEITWKGWRCARMPMTGQLTHWGGANDGLIHYPIAWDCMIFQGIGVPVDGLVYFTAPVITYPRIKVSTSTMQSKHPASPARVT